MPWIPVLALKLDVDEDHFLFSDSDEYREHVYTYKKTGIRSEDIVDFYEFKNGHILVKTRYDERELIIKDSRDSFLSKLSILDHMFEVKFVESDEEQEFTEEDENS